MKILYHHRTQAEDAQGIHIREMVKAFRALGHEVEMVALVTIDAGREKTGPGGPWKWVVRWAPHWLYDLMGLAYNLYGYLRLCREIQSKRPDLIYERYSLYTLCGVWASRRYGIPLVLEVNAPLAYEQSRLGRLTFTRLARVVERWVCSQSTLTVVVSRVMQEYLMREGVPEAHMVVIPNGIDPQEFHPGVSGQGIRQRYDLEGKLVIGFVGWFRKWHGLEMLLEVMQGARLADRDVRLLLVGDGPDYPDLYHYAQEHDLLSAVFFTGSVRREEIPTHIAAIDIAVQPSATAYACPMKIFEYMAMGKCIVAPDQPNIREILEDRITGFLFQPQDKESLRSTVLELCRDPAKREVTGHNARERIFERRHLWHANAEKTLALVFGKEMGNAGNRRDGGSHTGETAPMPAVHGTVEAGPGVPHLFCL